MHDVEKRFMNALEPQIINQFVDQHDINVLINFIEFLDTRTELGYHNTELGHHNNKRVYNPEYLDIVDLVKKYSKKVFDNYPSSEPIYVHVMGLIKYVEGDWMEVHWDWMDENCNSCVLSSVMYLNEDYSGGEIKFPNLGKEYHPKPGAWISYPSLDTRFNHGVNIVTSGVRYALAWCFTTDSKKAFKPYMLTDRT